MTGGGISLRRRLVLQQSLAFLVVALALFFSVRFVAERAAQSTQDNVLAASVTSILEEVSVIDDELTVDIPYGALAMLGAVGDDLVFYRVEAPGIGLITGYSDLPLPAVPPATGRLVSYDAQYKDNSIRVTTASRPIFTKGETVLVQVAVGQTRESQAEIIEAISMASAAVGVGFLVLAVGLSWLAMNSAMSPVRSVTSTLEARSPKDLNPIEVDPPEEIAPLVQALNTYLRRTRRTLDQMENFIAEGAHRIRTPLAGVRAQAEIAMRNARQDQTRAAFQKILLAVDQTARMANQMLNQAMTAYRADRWEPGPVDLADLVTKVVEDSRIAGDLKDIDIGFRLAGGIPGIHGDAVLLTEGLRNLIDNAIKYSPPESTVLVELTRAAAWVALVVRDQGPGIPEDEIHTVTERFARGQAAGDTVGSGLGLNIVEMVAEAHGGVLDLSSPAEGGLIAALRIPLETRS